ncbi:MAG: DUF507 domain-containing protein [Thermodesulfovibrio sp.]|nr:DUF507 domain-containing protein [Thermodesulfovibrio sp.]
MRIPKSWVPSISKRIVDNLIKKELIDSNVSVDNLIAETEKLLLTELTAEDRLNDEVRQLLKKYETEIEKGRLDYRKLFDMTKQKLVRERNIIL